MTPNIPPNFPPRQPRMLNALTRPELAARVQTLGDALDALWDLTDAQRAMPFTVIGQMKEELFELEQRLHATDRAAAAAAGQSLEQIAAVVVQKFHRVAVRDVPIPLDVAIALAGRSA